MPKNPPAQARRSFPVRPKSNACQNGHLRRCALVAVWTDSLGVASENTGIQHRVRGVYVEHGKRQSMAPSSPYFPKYLVLRSLLVSDSQLSL